LYQGVDDRYSPAGCALRTTSPPPNAVRAWNDGTIPRLAAAAIAGQVSVVAVLADALLDAGCEDEGLMDHLRQPVEHPDWCWAIHSAALPVTRRNADGRAPEVAPTPPRATSGARRMGGVRLGERERHLLLDLSGVLVGWSRQAPESAADTRSGREVTRRALRRLESLGLVRSEGGRPTLTDLGRTVTATYQRELVSGGRIRWGRN
jgi:hypothetical protein